MSNDQYYGGQQYDPYANADANGQTPADVTQTWEGQTWDTTYQPAVSYDQIQAARAQGQAQAQAAETRLQPQAAPPPQHQAPAGHGTPEPYGQQPYQQQPYEQYPSQGDPAAYYAEPAPAPTAFAEPAPAAYPESGPEPAPPAAPVADAGPAYSSPTTSGNTRITDAQRARAEGRSPVIEPGMQPAALTAVLGLLLAGGASLGSYGLLVPLVLLQGLTAAGWFRLNGMWPARQGIALAFLGGLVADAALLATGREHAAAAILGTLGVWVLLCLVLQLRSHADPDERMYGLMATIASAALTVVATGHLGAAPDAVVVGGTAVAAAVLARALPLPGPVSLVAALLASAGAGIAAGGLTDLGTSGALLGLGAGVCALVGLRAASYDYPSRFVHMTAGVALPLTAAAPAVYLLGRALV
ncbi:hypothetical protein [Streptomyces sp. TLI_105]|uniref:hypothetical protein n=1 Tax=Streptomyces sp. TLI_105 TaxID=1881019 RepID=UPI00089B7CBD|nr:hypothetical protein [Streptomyces sp. TLI_105]SEC88573.1 hypothetical protein SAMN05428939_3539 [Streptomyces sp. TLI_105]